MRENFCAADCSWILLLTMEKHKALLLLVLDVLMTLNLIYFGNLWAGFVYLKDLEYLIKILGNKQAKESSMFIDMTQVIFCFQSHKKDN